MTQNSQSFQETHFHANGLKLAAKVWHPNAPHKVIAIHGWLDNANSFDTLAPLLGDFNIVALDSAGHGKSDFRSEDAAYLIWSEVAEIIQIADQMGWDNFILLGHSRGAGIASIVAGTYPDRVSQLVLLEGGIPLPMTAQDAPENLAKSIVLNRQLYGTKGTLFKTRPAAIAARADGFTKVYPETAEILADRSLVQESQGFRWHADARLKAPSGFKLTNNQIDAFLGKISAPSLLVLGHEGIAAMMEFTQTHFQNIANLKKLELPGGHHLHMEGAEEPIANAIKELMLPN